MSKEALDKAILAACRRSWTRWESIVSAVLKVHKTTPHKDLEEAVDRLTADGKLRRKDDGHIARSKWRKT